MSFLFESLKPISRGSPSLKATPSKLSQTFLQAIQILTCRSHYHSNYHTWIPQNIIGDRVMGYLQIRASHWEWNQPTRGMCLSGGKSGSAEVVNPVFSEGFSSHGAKG